MGENETQRGALTKALLSARWPDGSRDGFPTRTVAEMLADAMLASDWLATHVREQVDVALGEVEQRIEARVGLDRSRALRVVRDYRKERTDA